MIKRLGILVKIKYALRHGRIVALLGPRQSGKTTLARQFIPADSVNYFDLEDPVSMARLAEPKNPISSLLAAKIKSGPASAKNNKNQQNRAKPR